MLKHFLAVPGQMFGVENRLVDVVFAKEIGQRLLALDLGKSSQVSVTPQQIEGVKDKPILATGREFCLQLGEVGAALVDDDDFPVDDGLPRNIDGAGNDRKALGPIQPGAGVDLLLPGADVNLDAVAVIFDFVKPLLTLGSPGA
jgi:hypothetical protein